MNRDDMTEFKKKLEEWFGHPVRLSISIHGAEDRDSVELMAHAGSLLTDKPIERHAHEGTWWAETGDFYSSRIRVSVFGDGPAPDGWDMAAAAEEV